MVSAFNVMLDRHVRNTRKRAMALSSIVGCLGLLLLFALGYGYLSNASGRYAQLVNEGRKQYVAKALAACAHDTYNPTDLAACQQHIREQEADDLRIQRLELTSERRAERLKFFVGLGMALLLLGLARVFGQAMAHDTDALRTMFASPDKIVWIYPVEANVNGITTARPIAIVARDLGEARLLGNPQAATLAELRQLVPHAVFGYGTEHRARVQALLGT